jgi:V/A-type H+-transporting ATPase subunit E
MPLQDILRKIEETSSVESQKVLAEAEDRSHKIALAAREEASSRRERILGEARAQASKAESLSKARADAQRRQLILKEKQEMVDSVFADAMAKLAQMPASEYRDMTLRALCSFAQGDETVTFGPEDEARLGSDFAQAANGALKSAGKEGRLTVAYAPSSLGGGLILTRGGVSQNLTFPTLVGRLRDEMEMEIARVLFTS